MSAPAVTPDKIEMTLSAGVAAEPNRPNMWAKNATLYKGESLELHFKTPNPTYLGLIDPKGRFFYLVFPGESAVGALTPLVESKIFAGLKTLNINTGLLKADPYTYGVYTNQPVFIRSGTYTFILGENLHVDDPGLLTKVRVRYVHGPRPSPVAKDVAIN